MTTPDRPWTNGQQVGRGTMGNRWGTERDRGKSQLYPVACQETGYRQRGCQQHTFGTPILIGYSIFLGIRKIRSWSSGTWPRKLERPWWHDPYNKSKVRTDKRKCLFTISVVKHSFIFFRDSTFAKVLLKHLSFPSCLFFQANYQNYRYLRKEWRATLFKRQRVPINGKS